MQFSILKTLTVAIGLTSSTLANPILAPRSIPALQGWPGKNYTVSHPLTYLVFSHLIHSAI